MPFGLAALNRWTSAWARSADARRWVRAAAVSVMAEEDAAQQQQVEVAVDVDPVDLQGASRRRRPTHDDPTTIWPLPAAARAALVLRPERASLP